MSRASTKPGNGILRAVVLACLALLIATSIPIPDLAGTAYAQEVRERRSILDLLFRNRAKVPKKQPSVVKIKRPSPKSQNRKRDTAATNVVEQVEKLPDARTVLVVGDFMASALADGLEMATAEDAGIVINKQTDGSSGIVRDDHLDWPVVLKAKIEDIKPALVVIMIGSNDRQQMVVNGERQKFRTEAWQTEYERRINLLIRTVAESKTPLIWTGLPSFELSSLSIDAAAFNNVYRSKVEMAGGVFIDIWDGFADENGKFIASGSDINGQPVRLRGSDGLSLTKAGKRKMAFYLEKDMRRLLGVTTAPDLLRLDSSNLPLESSVSAPADILTVAPISLADPELDGSSALLDKALLPKASGKTPRDRLIQKGETVEAPEGRIDDFKWKPEADPAG